MNYELLEKWWKKIGKAEALVAVLAKTKWSGSKADKVLRGKYEHPLDHLDMKALSEVTNIPMEKLFPSAKGKGPNGGDAA